MEYKGIILAGGSGTRLWPITSSFSKHFIPVFDKQMIYYPLTTLILAGVKEVLIICNSTDKDLFKSLLSNGKQWGIKITYELQAKPRGIAEALIIAEDFIDNCSSILILGDNFLYGPGLGRNLSEFITRKGAAITAYEVSEPSQFGVVVFDKEENPTELIEKPEKFISKWAIPGIYFYDKTASERAKLLKPSNRGELEITELNRSYLEDGQLKVHKLPRGTAWLDLGTSIGILEAGSFVRILQDRQGILVGSPHEAALQVELISKKDLVIDLKDQKSNYAKKIIGEIIEQF
jgi:glucose-1-phosphate thymidylyltransferase